MYKQRKKYTAEEAIDLFFTLPSDPEDSDLEQDDETDDEFTGERSVDLSDPLPSTSRGVGMSQKMFKATCMVDQNSSDLDSSDNEVEEDWSNDASALLPTQSLEDQQCDEALDCKIVQLIRDAVLPFANQLPREFIIRVVTLLNKGSIHSATGNSPVDIDSSRKLREEFAKACFETLLQFSFFGHEIGKFSDDSDVVNLLAVTSLLQRFQEVICKYAEDERLSGKCPLPRHRMSEISFVLKAVATLARSLKKADPEKVEWTVWEQLIALYPHLVDCTTSTSNQVCRSLREALHEYAVLLKPPQQFLNGDSR